MIKYFVTGIGTGVGKTIVSAICAEALSACYWKPVQAGNLNTSDSLWVAEHTSRVRVLPEQFLLKQPMSPHRAAELDSVSISVKSFCLPDTGDSNLIIEGAGGLLVPLNNHETILDLIKQLSVPVVIVSMNYLGSINHTLLTIQTLQSHSVTIRGLIYSGEQNNASESVIQKMTGVSSIGRVPFSNTIDKNFILTQAESLRGVL
jgi:dethiobiotin synthetase